ncbi:fibronectin type III domain-containing protein [Curtobacterium sp. DN_7.5]|uniref:fibronectin type III domain-containing protein n=1 Tax=Curtobacterium sp. DN_7.5 TaxID=3049047 RepID=UPI001F59DA7A|nr:fibronectin type III domain-containing protein [Curtobacterium sp. DN_7.5]
MYRAVLTAAAAAALVIGGVTPAVAATPASRLPGVPTSVHVSGAGDAATLTWGAPRSGGVVQHWRVSIRPTEGQPGSGTDVLPATARSDRYGWIRAGVRYTFSVQAVGAKGDGRAVSVRYTAPATTAVTQSLYGLDASGAVVRFPTSGSGAPKTVVKHGAGFAADDVGNVFVPSSDGTKLLQYPADGGAARVLASGLHLTKDLRSDVPGNVYWEDSVTGAIVKLPIGGGVPKTILPSTGTAWTVGRDGTVSTFTTTANGGTVVSRSVHGDVTTRTVANAEQQPIGYFGGLLADGQGTLYVDYRAFGGSAYNGFWSLAPGSSTLVKVSKRTAYQFSATNDDSLLLGQSAGWCAAISEADPFHPCTADHAVAHLFVQDASGATEDLAVTGGPKVWTNGFYPSAADSAGDLFVDADSGLWRIPAEGGAAQRLATGQYDRLLAI